MENLKKFISNFSNSAQTILKVLIFSRFFTKSPKRKNKECVILANGPSLTDSLEVSDVFLEEKDLICMNFFPNNQLFQKLKPPFFICCDPVFWQPELVPELSAQIDNLFTAIGKVTWEITVLMPTKARRRKEWKIKLDSNKKVNILYYNTTPVAGFDRINFFFLKKRLGSPNAYNVLIPSIVVSINMSYDKIYLFGVDHSWLKDLTVSENNEVFTTSKHFYSNENSKSKVQNGRDKNNKWKLHEVLEVCYIVFRGYDILSKYAKSQNVEVFNLTPGSYIDTFPRLKHPEETMME